MTLAEIASESLALSSLPIADRIHKLLDAAPVTPAYRAALTQALAAPGNILSNTGEARWARLVCVCCIAAGQAGTEAVTVAAAVELFMAALNLLDDIEDGDEPTVQIALGPGPMLNVSTGLLFLTQACLLDTAHGANAARILNEAGLVACSGQHADLQTYTDRSLPLDESLEITERKSAALVAAICRLGALCGGADEPRQLLYARFGSYLGMVLQLIDDIADICPQVRQTADIAFGRPTLPMVYAMLHGIAGSGDTPAQSGDLLTRGPAYLTWAVAEVYRRRALELIPQLTSEPSSRAALTQLVPTLM